MLWYAEIFGITPLFLIYKKITTLASVSIAKSIN